MNHDLTKFGGKLLPISARSGFVTPPLEHWNFGWIPPDSVNTAAADAYWQSQSPGNQVRRSALNVAHASAVAAMPAFRISGAWKMDKPRYALWKAGPLLLGKFLPYNWQLTGSCVGAGGGNMLKTLMAVEIAFGGQLEEYHENFWPFTYGISRMLDGSRGPGEGSTGASWSKAVSEYGSFAADEGSGLPAFKVVDSWIQLTEQIEMKWSDGNAIADSWRTLGRQHLVKTVAPLRNHEDVMAALVNGHAVTQASNFGFNPMVPNPQGTPPVRLTPWNGSWSHQTYIDEVWDHPTLGLIFRWGNNWGPTAHGTPTGDEPPGGVYITAATVDQICRGGEVYGYSAYDGFPARKINWFA